MIVRGWGVWHPKKGFWVPDYEKAAIAWAAVDGVVNIVRMLNSEDGTTNRNGWRAVPVEIVRAPT